MKQAPAIKSCNVPSFIPRVVSFPFFFSQSPRLHHTIRFFLSPDILFLLRNNVIFLLFARHNYYYFLVPPYSSLDYSCRCQRPDLV